MCTSIPVLRSVKFKVAADRYFLMSTVKLLEYSNFNS